VSLGVRRLRIASHSIPAVPVNESLQQATLRLAAAGVASPRVDAEWLLAHALGVNRSTLALRPPVSAAALDRCEALVEQRCRRVPIQHLLGTATFRYLDLAVGPGVFIPRPETELLVDAVLPELRTLAHPVVVDLGAGSGALALSIAHEVPGAAVYAVEQSADALRWLRRNAAARANAGDTPIAVISGDVKSPEMLADLTGRADVVVSNPPYVPTATDVDPEVRADPAEAVFAGADGMDVIPAVIAAAGALLRPGGVLAVEHDATQPRAVTNLLQHEDRFREIASHQDLTGRPRFATARRRAKVGTSGIA
jgi:release factor glutamine methyltransferase